MILVHLLSPEPIMKFIQLSIGPTFVFHIFQWSFDYQPYMFVKEFQLFQPYHARFLGATRPRLLVNSAGLGRRLRPLRHQLDQACVRQDGAPGFAKLLDNCKDHSV